MFRTLIKYSWFWCLIVSTLYLSNCSAPGSTNTNYAHMYKGNTSIMHPNFIVYHDQESTSKVFFKINSEELLYTRKDKAEPYRAELILQYRLYSDINSKLILDSSMKRVEDITKVKEPKELMGELEIKMQMGNKYLLKIIATDINRSTIHETHIRIDKTQPASSQFFIVKDAETDQPIFSNYINRSSGLRIVSDLNKGKTMFGRYYHRDFPISAPPFSTVYSKSFLYKPDSTFTINLNQEGLVNYQIQDSGFVHFQTDTTSKKGFTLYRYHKNFPDIKTADGMVKPLRYISTRSEFFELTSHESSKKAMDKFWLSKTGSKERGREVIKKYYNRVQNANQYFTSYIEGWKTDRGMISIIYGAPNVVTKNGHGEVWIYGEETNMMSLRFAFVKVENPFTDNDYKLERGQAYRSSWYRAVDAWRSGRVYWVD